MLRRGVPIHIWLGAQLPCTSQIDPELLFDERQSSHSERRANRRCAALSRSVQRLKGAGLSAMLEAGDLKRISYLIFFDDDLAC